jgi:hypothetical protein
LPATTSCSPFNSVGGEDFTEGRTASYGALYALNFSWSLLLLLTGALVLYAAFLGPSAGLFARRMIFVVGLFWAIHGVYTWINPFPLPRSLAWLGMVMAAFPAITITLHWLPLIATRAETVSSSSAIAVDRG